MGRKALTLEAAQARMATEVAKCILKVCRVLIVGCQASGIGMFVGIARGCERSECKDRRQESVIKSGTSIEEYSEAQASLGLEKNERG